MKVLLVFNDASVAEIVAASLVTEGFHVSHANTVDKAEVEVAMGAPDIVVVDWNLPQLTAVELCYRIKNLFGDCRTPVLMLTKPDQARDRICCQSSGTEHRMTKPYSITALAARIRNLATGPRSMQAGNLLSVGDLVLDRAGKTVRRGLHHVHLGPTEFRLLEILMENRGRVLSRQQLVDAIWRCGDPVYERTVDVHIGRLRRAVSSGLRPCPIRTIRGFGYVLGGVHES